MREASHPCSAAPRAPYWLIPTPCPKPRPSKVNDAGVAALAGGDVAEATSRAARGTSARALRARRRPPGWGARALIRRLREGPARAGVRGAPPPGRFAD